MRPSIVLQRACLRPLFEPIVLNLILTLPILCSTHCPDTDLHLTADREIAFTSTRTAFQIALSRARKLMPIQMPLIEMSPNIQESEAMGRKRSHEEFTDDVVKVEGVEDTKASVKGKAQVTIDSCEPLLALDNGKLLT